MSTPRDECENYRPEITVGDGLSREIIKELDASIGNIDLLLNKRGRASTPGPPNDSKCELNEILRISYHSSTPFHPQLRVATIVHDALYEEIEKKYLTFPILPSCLVRSIDVLQPKVIVIHRNAFQNGPWLGSEEAAGGTSVDLIRRILPWSRKRNVPVLFIENGLPDGYFTERLRELGTEHFPSFDGGRVPEGARRSEIYEIAQKFAVNRISLPNDMDL